MSEHSTEDSPAREYYTAQEILDLALEWGASATLTDDAGDVVIELERAESCIHLDLGQPSEFYDDLLCRAWVVVPSAPHRFCDRWNRFPYFGTFSVVYDESDFPERSENGFMVRAVKVIEFAKCRKHHDIILEVVNFWYGLELIKEGVARGETDIAQFRERLVEGGLTRWWFGGE